MKILYVFWVVAVCCLYLSATNAEKLSRAKLLLPYHPTIPVGYMLEVTEADPSICYRWYSSKPGVVSVEPIDPWLSDTTVCSHKVQVVSKSQTVSRNMAVVFAENIQTRQALKCHVAVEKVRSIMIESKSRELYLEDSPEPFKVLAMDEEGNIFSTLGLLPFEWLLLADGSVDQPVTSSTIPSQILRLVRYADTQYEAHEDISALEAGGARGYKVLLEGLQTGIAFISAKIKDPFYRDVKETHVKLRVVANVQLLPGEVYLMPLAETTVRAYMFRQNRPFPLQLPSSQYSAFVGEVDIATFDEKSSLIKAASLGSTNVTLIDKNIQIKDDYIPPSSLIYVEKPASLRMTVVQYPHSSSPWILEADRDYEFHIEVLDRLGHVLILPRGFVISCLLPSQYFEVINSTENGTIWHVHTTEIGEGVIPVSSTWSFKTFKVLLEHSQDFIIYAPIVVQPKLFGLPLSFAPDAFITHTLHVTGGSGKYIFISSDNKVATVDSTGVVRSVAVEPGSAQIKIIDQRNNKHSTVSVAVVGDVAELEFSPDAKVEGLIGSQLSIGIRANIRRGREKIPIANCSSLQFVLDLVRMPLRDSSADIDEQMEVFKLMGVSLPTVHSSKSDGLDCAFAVVDTLRTGFAELQIKSPMPASVVISGYSSLHLDLATDYEVDDVTTAVATRIRLPVVGGPLVWPSERERHVVTVEQTPKKTPSEFDFVFHWTNRAVELSTECKNYGTYELSVTVGNVRSVSHSPTNGVFEKLSITVSCPEPDSVQLSIPWGQDGTTWQPPCPAALDRSMSFPVVIHDNFPVVVTVFDKRHRKFMNISSYEFKWSFDKDFVSYVTKKDGVSYDRSLRSSVVNFNSKMLGEDTARVQLVGYTSNTGSLKIAKKGSLTASLGLRVVELARSSENNIVLFTIPSSTRKVQVLDGSGFFQFNIQERSFVNDKIASTIQSDFQTLSINPHGNGAFVIEPVDLCLRPGLKLNLAIEVKILSIDKLVVIGRRFIALGETLDIGLVAMDASGQHHLPANLYSSLNLKPIFAEDKISIAPSNFIGDIAIFTLTGQATGVTKLTFSASGLSASQVLASDFSIEICHPLEINPSPRLILIDGALYQLSIVGGPVSLSPKPAISFRFVGGLTSSDVISLDKTNGLIHGNKIGDVKIEAVLYDVDPLAARLGRHSVVEIVTPPLSVDVRHLYAVHLAGPSTQIETDTLMPVTVFGQYEPNQRLSFDFNPAGFGTASPPLTFSWSVSPNGPKVDLLSPMFGQLYSRPLEEDFTVYFRSSTPGDFVITVSVARHGQPTFRNLTSTLTVSVAAPFKIATVQPPFTVSVGSELHLPPSGSCLSSDGQPKYSFLSRTASFSCKNGSILPTSNEQSAVLIGPANSFIGRTPGYTSIMARCSAQEFLSFSFDVKAHFSYVVMELSKGGQQTGGVSSEMHGLPFGSSVSLDVNYYTQLGRRFDAVSGQLGCRLNRRDAVTFYLASGTPKSVAADLSLPHSVSVVACESDPAFPLFLALVVKPAIKPFSSSVTVGDLICFRHVLDDTMVDDVWSTSDSKNLFVDSSTGVGIALRPSTKETVSVEFGAKESHKFRARSAVALRPLSRIDFLPHQHVVISDTSSNNSIVFDLVIEDASHHQPMMVGSCPVNLATPTEFPLPVVCELSAPDPLFNLFAVSTYFDSTSSPPLITYHCQVRYVGANRRDVLTDMGILTEQDFSTMEFPLRLYASLISDSEFGGGESRQSTELIFLPNLHLSSTHLQLNANSLSANLTVAASERVFKSLVVMPSHSSFLSITGPTPVSGQYGKYVFEISMASHRRIPVNLFDKLHLLVRVPLLNQENTIQIELPSSFTSKHDAAGAGEESLFTRLFGSTSPTVIMSYIIVAIIVLLITIHVTVRGGIWGQPVFVQTLYSYDNQQPLRTPPTPPLRRSPVSTFGSDLDSQLLTAFRSSSRTPVRPSGPSVLSPGGGSGGGGSSGAQSRLWSTGYVPEGNINTSFGRSYNEN